MNSVDSGESQEKKQTVVNIPRSNSFTGRNLVSPYLIFIVYKLIVIINILLHFLQMVDCQHLYHVIMKQYVNEMVVILILINIQTLYILLVWILLILYQWMKCLLVQWIVICIWLCILFNHRTQETDYNLSVSSQGGIFIFDTLDYRNESLYCCWFFC